MNKFPVPELPVPELPVPELLVNKVHNIPDILL